MFSKLRSLFSKSALIKNGPNAPIHQESDDPFCCSVCGREYPKPEGTEEYEQWCTICDRQKLIEKFGSWTSGNEALDKFIQRTQLESKKYTTYVEWAEPEEFMNITHLADGGFGSVYKANWSKGWRGLIKTEYNGPVKYLWKVNRNTNREVALKTLKLGETAISEEFFNEVSVLIRNTAFYLIIII